MKMPKSGFGVPIGEWLAGNSTLRTFFEEMFLDREINKIFEVEELRKIFYMHRERVVDHSEILWLILNFYLWHTNFYRNQR
jgi:hypothetical protein